MTSLRDMEKDPWNMIIAGVGGQGNVLASQILGQMLVTEDYFVTIGETYGLSQRGGSVMSHLRISMKDQFSPLIPKGTCDFVMGLEPTEALRVLQQFGNPNVQLLINTRPIYPMDVIAGDAVYPEVNTVLEKVHKLSQRVWTIKATEIYTRVDPTDKLTAISFMAPPTLRKGHFRPPDKLIALLKGGSLWGAQSGNDAARRHAAPANSP